jgi:hypothetical protein
MKGKTQGETVDRHVRQLLVDVYMGEYTALREEILLHMRRVSNLVVYSIVGTGALVGSTAVTSFADRPDVFASVLLLVSAVLAMVSATCIGTTIKILLISGYLADRADEMRGLLRPAGGKDSPISVDMFSWERQSINVPPGFFTMLTLRSWGGSILEILVVGLLAIAAWAAAVSILFQQEAARTPVTILLAVVDAVVEVAIMVWGTRVGGPRGDKKGAAKGNPGADGSQPGGGAAGVAP